MDFFKDGHTDSDPGLLKPDRSSPMYTPFLFESHAGLPPMYVQACGLDPFRDGCLIYIRLLGKVGVKNRLDLYDGLPHSFWTAYPSLCAAKRWLKDTLKGVEWLLISDDSSMKTKL